jgi:hypothetical protein
VWVAIARLVFVVGLCGSIPVVPRVTAQQSQASAPEESETFSDTVVELSSTQVTISRSILGSAAEKRTFLLKPETRVEGHLRTKARVTVGFVTTDEGDIARLIVVREKQPKKP